MGGGGLFLHDTSVRVPFLVPRWPRAYVDGWIRNRVSPSESAFSACIGSGILDQVFYLGVARSASHIALHSCNNIIQIYTYIHTYTRR